MMAQSGEFSPQLYAVCFAWDKAGKQRALDAESWRVLAAALIFYLRYRTTKPINSGSRTTNILLHQWTSFLLFSSSEAPVQSGDTTSLCCQCTYMPKLHSRGDRISAEIDRWLTQPLYAWCPIRSSSIAWTRPTTREKQLWVICPAPCANKSERGE